MAFHPFRTFRKNQKAWLAALTILSMLSFVVLGSMSGTVDYFARAFGANKGKTMLEVHGKPIYFTDLQGLRIRRDAVNTFMATAVDFAKRKAFGLVQSNAQDWKDPQAQQQMMQVVIAHYTATGALGDQGGMSVEQKLGALNQAYNTLLGLQFGAKARNNTKEAEDLDTLAQILISDYQDAIRSKGETYFGGKLDTEGLADFMLLREQADRLGISLKDDGVEQLVQQDTLNMLTPQDLQALANRVRQNYGRTFRTEDWNAALRDEFRVRLAREALLGYNPSRPTPGYEMGLPLALVGHEALTPYGLWQDYQQARAERRIGLLPISVNDKKFISQVPAPKESELVAFFEKYKNKPRDPNVAEPGFMVPERYAIEWVGTRKDAPYFVNKAEGQLRAKVAAVVATSNLGLTPALADADLVNWFSKLDSLTQDLKFNRLWDDGSYYEKIRSRGEPTSAADTAAAVAAALGSATASSAPALVGASALQSSLAGTELQNAMLPAFDATLVGLAGTPGMGWVPATTWLKYTDINKRYLPEAVAQARAYEELRGEVASKLVNDALQDLQNDLQSRSSLVNASAGADFQRLYEPPAGHVPAVVSLLSAQLGATAPAGAITAAVLAGPAAQQYPATVEARSRLTGQMLAAGTNPFTLLAVTAHELSPAAALMRQPIDQAVRTYGLDHAAMPAPVDRFDLAKAKALTRLKDAVESASPESQSAESRDTQFMNTLVGNPDQAP
ncbi:MAG TPA: hypothetical protein VFA18_17315, partial [Gemmataceae bacterium]|nr:hypothetical protein [Gemmataceae bacterium]